MLFGDLIKCGVPFKGAFKRVDVRPYKDYVGLNWKYSGLLEGRFRADRRYLEVWGTYSN